MLLFKDSDKSLPAPTGLPYCSIGAIGEEEREEKAIKSADYTDEAPVLDKDGPRMRDRSPNHHATCEWPICTQCDTAAAEEKKVFLTKHKLPMTFEFQVGDISAISGVDVVINPTNKTLDGQANPVSESIQQAVGPDEYKSLRLSATGDNGMILEKNAVLTGGGSLLVKDPIHVDIPSKFVEDFGFNVIMISECYESCLDMLRMNRLMSVAFPPLGVESGLDVGTAAGGAVMAFENALGGSAEVPLPVSLDIVRFVFGDPITMHEFADLFSAQLNHFLVNPADSKAKKSQLKSRKVPTAQSGVTSLQTVRSFALQNKNDGKCSVCLSQLNDGQTIETLPNCGHTFHRECIEAWFYMKPICPNCKKPRKRLP